MHPGTHAATTPDKPALIMASTGRTTTFAQLEDRSLRLAHVLRDAGLKVGDHVALLTDNQPEALEVYWACMRSGLYITAINWHLAEEEARYILEDCEAVALVASASVPELADALAADAPQLRLRLCFGGVARGYDSYEEALAQASNAPLADQPRGADMLYSSGTTGRPKGILTPLPDRQVDEPGDVMLGLVTRAFGMGETSVYLSPAPIYHAAPLRFSAAAQAAGATVVMMERFEAVDALHHIDKYNVTHSQWVPTMFIRMLKLPEHQRAVLDGSTHKVAIHAAAPCPQDVKQAMIRWWGPILTEYYAATEASGITLVTSEEWLEHPGTVGRAILGKIRICDDQGAEVPTGQNGTVYFEREARPFEYHNDPDKTRSATHPSHDTWTTTGDIGYLDEDGYLYLTDRKSFMIISGGVNIYPQEIENVLALHPHVADVAVIGVPDAEMGEQVKAVVQPDSNAVPGEELEKEILDFLRPRIAHYKMPRSVDFIAELPRTPTGKLVKGPLRQRYVARSRGES